MDAAIIGMGSMGRRHVKVVRMLGLQLVGVCDKNPEALRAAGEQCDIPKDRCYAEAGEMLSVTHPECIIIATTAPTHSFYTCLAAEAGTRYILCEKPMAVSLRECDRMLDVCRTQGVRFAVNHQMRFMDHYCEPKRIIQSDEFGGLSSVTVVSGNFGMATNGLHYFEMFRYMSEERPRQVTAWLEPRGAPDPRGKDFEDRAGSIRVATPNGKRLYMEIGADQGHGIKVVYAGPYGQLVVDELTGTMHLSVREAQDRCAPSVRYALPGKERVLQVDPTETIKSSARVLDALINGGGFPSGEDARSAVAVLVAAYVSDERGALPIVVEEHALPIDRTFAWS